MIESFFFAPALAVAAQGHVFDLYDDAGLCEVISRNMTRVPPPVHPVKDARLAADCQAKKVRARVDFDLTGDQFDHHIDLFMQTARSGVCDPANDTMVVFKRRGWGFAYTFTAADGETVQRELTC